MRRLAFVVALLLLWVGAAGAQNGFVYTNNDTPFRANSVSAYAINAGGSLTQIAGSPFLTAGMGGGGGGFSGARRIVVSPDNKFLFVANGGSNDISVFSVDATAGTLTPVAGSPFPSGGWTPTGLTASSDGKFLFSANSDSGTISAFAVNADGSLTAVPGSPFATGQYPEDLKIAGGGKFLAAALGSYSGGMIGVYTINADGSLTPVAGSPFADGNKTGYTTSVESNCAGDRLWAMTGDGYTFGKIDAFQVNTDGTLLAAPGSPFVDAGNSTSAVLLSPSETVLFATDQNNSITVFNVAGDGSLTPTGAPVAVNTAANYLSTSATDAQGQFLYAAGYPFFILGFSVDGAGTLTPLPSMPIQTGVYSALQSLVTYPNRSCKKPITVIPVMIDIKPTDSSNRINRTSQGKLTVAILSTADFNAPARVDATTLTFGHTGAEQSLAFCDAPVDVNGDGLLDLQCHFSTPLAAFQAGDTQGFLLGMTVEGVQIAGADAVSLVSSSDNTVAPAKRGKIKHHTKKTRK